MPWRPNALRNARSGGAGCGDDHGLDRDFQLGRSTTCAVFFASAQGFIAGFDFRDAIERVRIDVRAANIWDLSAVGALDKVVLKFRREGARVELLGQAARWSTGWACTTNPMQSA